MSSTGWFILIFVVTDLIAVLLIVRTVVASNFTPIADGFPEVETTHGLDYKRRQSFSFGLLNLGFSIAVAIDDRHVHMRPEPWAALLGVSPASIPSEAITAKGSRRGKWLLHEMRIEHPSGSVTELRGPRWLWEAIDSERSPSV